MNLYLKKNEKNIIYIIIFSIVYFSYILFVGFSPGDDSFHINFVNDNPKIIDNIKENLNITPARPVGGLMVGFFHPILTDNSIFYNILSLGLWTSTALILKKAFRILINKQFSELFFLIFSFPYLCFAIFYGNLLWAYYIAFIFFWSISILFQIKYYEKNLNKHKLFYLFFLFISIFTFELIIPLLIINIFLPLHYKNKIKDIIYNFLYILIFALVFLIYKIYLLPYFLKVPIYGLSELNLVSFLQGLYFFYTISVENLILLLESLKFSYNLISLSIFILLLFLFRNKKIQSSFKNNLILIIFILSLVSNIIVFFISGYPAITYGHYAKMLVPAFFSMTFILTYIFLYYKVNRWFLIIFIFLIINSTYIQIHNYIEATKIKKNLIENLIINIKKNEIKKSDIILVNSPLFVENNYNNEEIVFTTWDLKFTILNKTKKNTNSWLINDRLINNPSYYPVANFMNSEYLRNESNDDIKVFYYQHKNNSKNFEIYETREEVLKKINYLKKNPTNVDKFILREKIRQNLKNIIFNLIY